MELILTIVVAAAVVSFGALISAGNERQRKAIDGLREQIVLWAVQDLRIKRERLARDVQVDDPLRWLNRVASNACGYNLSLQVIEIFDNPQVLICSTKDGNGRVVFTQLSPSEIDAMQRSKHNRLSQLAGGHPLLSIKRDMSSFKCSVLNSGILFDLELALAWKKLTGIDANHIEHLWIYLPQ